MTWAQMSVNKFWLDELKLSLDSSKTIIEVLESDVITKKLPKIFCWYILLG